MSANEHTHQDDPETAPDHHDRRSGPDPDSNLTAYLWQMLHTLGVQDGRMLVSYALPVAPAGVSNLQAPRTGHIVARIPSWPHTELQPDQRTGTSPDRYDLVIHNIAQPDTRSHRPHNIKTLVDQQAQTVLTALDRTTPGGFTVVIVSHQVLDFPDARHRHQIHAMADLVGAVRVPATLLPRPSTRAGAQAPDGVPGHSPTLGTGTAVDLLVLRRRPDGERDRSMPFIFISPVMVDGIPAAVNEYFDEMPEHVLGTHHHTHDRPGRALVITPAPDIDRDLLAALSAVARRGTTRGLTAGPSPWRPPDQGPAPHTGQAGRSPTTPNPWTTPGVPHGHGPGPGSRPDPAPTTGLEW